MAWNTAMSNKSVLARPGAVAAVRRNCRALVLAAALPVMCEGAWAQENSRLEAADVLHPFVYFCLDTDGDRLAIAARAKQQNLSHVRIADTEPDAPWEWSLHADMTLTSAVDGSCAIKVAQPFGQDMIEAIRRTPHALYHHFEAMGDIAEARFAVLRGDGEDGRDVRIFKVVFDLTKAEIGLLDRASLRREREIGNTRTLAPEIVAKREFGPEQAFARFQRYCVDTLGNSRRADELAVIDGGFAQPTDARLNDARIWFFPNLFSLVILGDDCSLLFDNEHRPLRDYGFGEKVRSSLIRKINNTLDHARYEYRVAVPGDDGAALSATVVIEAATDSSQFRLIPEADAPVEAANGNSTANAR